MYIHNVATVFGPNLLKQQGANMLQMVEHTPQINSIVATLIKNYDFLFEEYVQSMHTSEQQKLVEAFFHGSSNNNCFGVLPCCPPTTLGHDIEGTFLMISMILLQFSVEKRCMTTLALKDRRVQVHA